MLADYDPPPLDDLVQKLPERYAAVRFYHSACFPDTARTRAFVRRTLEALTAPAGPICPGLPVVPVGP